MPTSPELSCPMKTQNFLSSACWIVVLFALVAFFPDPVAAQTTLSGDHTITGDLHLGTSGTPGNLTVNGETGSGSGPGLKVTGDGGVLFTGTFGVGQIPIVGEGTRFMWYPKKAALRAGRTLGTEWNDSSVGNHSVAMGFMTTAEGENSTALGVGSWAAGEGSTALGQHTYAGSYASLAIGRYNIGDGHPTQWLENDPIFEIGNGTSTTPSNALTVFKNGKLSLQGSGPSSASIVFDPNTAQILVGGQPLLIPNGSGNVGIGVAVPTRKLEVRQDNSGNESILAKFTNNQKQAGSASTLEFGVFDRSAKIQVLRTGDNEGNDMTFLVDDTGAGNVPTERMRIAESGNVGIGTATPGAKLHVHGTLGVGSFTDYSLSPGLTVSYADGGHGTTTFYGNRWGQNWIWMHGSSAGNTPQMYLSTWENSLHLYNSVTGTSGIITVKMNPVGASYLNGGNVGIGTTSPQAKLDVNGDARFSGAVRIAPQGDLSMGSFTN